MKRIDVIGAGPGDERMLTGQAREALEAADVVFCADRNAPLVRDAAKRRSLTPLGAALEELAAAREAGLAAAVLVSGDAGLYSFLGMLTRRFGREALRAVPGVSSVQALMAALALPWQEAKILSLHGRDVGPEALCHHVRTNARTLMLLDGQNTPHTVARTLEAGGLERVRLTVGERLSSPEERVAPYDPLREYDPLAVALAENDAPARGLPPVGLDDEAFVRGKTPMTKREIRMQVLAELDPPPDAVVWDVGSGTGSVTVECARRCPLGRVYAVERDEEALELTRANVAAFRLQNVEVVPGAAPEALEGLPAPTHVFLGGTGRKAEAIMERIAAFPAPVRVCAAAVTLESCGEFTRLLSAHGNFRAAQVAVSRLEKLGGYRMFRAQNPVFIFTADTEGSV